MRSISPRKGRLSRTQLGKSYDDPSNPDYTGFTVDEIDKRDFSRLYLSEYFNESQAQAIKTDLAPQQTETAVQQKVQNYFEK